MSENNYNLQWIRGEGVTDAQFAEEQGIDIKHVGKPSINDAALDIAYATNLKWYARQGMSSKAAHDKAQSNRNSAKKDMQALMGKG